MASPAYTLYTTGTPNGWKVGILMEELGLDYKVVSMDVKKGTEHKSDWFMKINPNGRVPALVDHGAGDTRVFESGAIMWYLATKHGKFFPKEPKAQAETMSWVMWQMGGVGPMQGQAVWWQRAATEKVDYAIKRYLNESERLYQTLETALEGKEWLANNEYSIADMIIFPWTLAAGFSGLSLEDKPNIRKWQERCEARPATSRGLDVPEPNMIRAARKNHQ